MSTSRCRLCPLTFCPRRNLVRLGPRWSSRIGYREWWLTEPVRDQPPLAPPRPARHESSARCRRCVRQRSIRTPLTSAAGHAAANATHNRIASDKKWHSTRHANRRSDADRHPLPAAAEVPAALIARPSNPYHTPSFSQSPLAWQPPCHKKSRNKKLPELQNLRNDTHLFGHALKNSRFRTQPVQSVPETAALAQVPVRKPHSTHRLSGLIRSRNRPVHRRCSGHGPATWVQRQVDPEMVEPNQYLRDHSQPHL